MSPESVSPQPLVLLKQPAPGVALLRLNRPQALNALNMALREGWPSTFAAWMPVPRRGWWCSPAAIGCLPPAPTSVSW